MLTTVWCPYFACSWLACFASCYLPPHHAYGTPRQPSAAMSRAPTLGNFSTVKDSARNTKDPLWKHAKLPSLPHNQNLSLPSLSPPLVLQPCTLPTPHRRPDKRQSRMNISFLSPVSYPTLSSVPLTLWHIHSLPEPKKGYSAAVPYICTLHRDRQCKYS